MKNTQYKKGFIAPIVLIMSLCTIAMTAFVIETGRMIDTRSSLDNGVELAVSGGVQQYGQALEEKTKEVFDEERDEAEEYVEQKILDEGLVLTFEEHEDMVKEKQRKLTFERKNEITEHARTKCRSMVSSLLVKNKVTQVTVSCTDSEVSVTGTKQYSQMLSGGLPLKGKEFHQQISENIIIQQ